MSGLRARPGDSLRGVSLRGVEIDLAPLGLELVFVGLEASDFAVVREASVVLPGG